jgi:hypothetical protein
MINYETSDQKMPPAHLFRYFQDSEVTAVARLRKKDS